MTYYALVPLFSTFVAIAIGLIVYNKNPVSKLNRIYVVFSMAVAYWGFIAFNIQISEDFSTAYFLEKLNFAWLLMPPILFHFSLVLTKKDAIFDNKLFLLFIYLPSLIFILEAVLDVNKAGLPYEQSWGWSYFVPEGPPDILDYLFIAWGFTLGFSGVIRIVVEYFRTYDYNFKKQVKYVSIGLVILMVLGMFDYNYGYRHSLPEVNHLGFVILDLFMGYAMWKYALFDINPITAAENIVQTMSDSLLLLDPEMKIRLVNKALAELTNYKKGELFGKGLKQVLHSKSYSVIEKISQNNVIEGQEADVLTKGGKKKPVSFSATPIKGNQGKTIGIVCIAKDISEAKESERILLKQTKDLERINRILEGREVKLKELKDQLKKAK
ncbi:PAS domain S-box protein [Candidatus Dojkabacteria bacterium]|nr:PAS domain S-box protein [Candidatus Dojkabacteria bacterium]